MKKNQADHPASHTKEEFSKQHHIEQTALSRQLKEASQNFFDSKNHVLKNKYHITDAEILKTQCAHDVSQQMINIRQEAPPEQFNSSYLKHIHKVLFTPAFEWAGQTREHSFTFADGTTASMPYMKRKEYTKPFAIGSQIQAELDKLDKTLTEKNNLQGLPRKEFVAHAAELMANLYCTHPFREGNRRTQHAFFEKLAESAGHKFDFSLVTRKRHQFINNAAIEYGNSGPMKHMLEDISHPEKVLLLKEFTNIMRENGLDEKNYRLAVVAQDGKTYHGTYRGCSLNSFMVDVHGTFIIGNKKDLTPEQIKTLKIGTLLSFTAQEQHQTLIPKETIPPLSKEEIAERIQENALVQEKRKEIEYLCKIVYGKPYVLQKKIEKIDENFAQGERLAFQVVEFPTSLSKLSGVQMFGIKSRARAQAEENIFPLSKAIERYAETLKQVEQEVLQNHHAQQKRCEQAVDMPSQKIQDLLSLSPDQQQEALSRSPELKAETKTYLCNLNARLSTSEHEAVKEKNYEKLAQSLGTSTIRAKEITDIFQQTKEIKQNLQRMSFFYHEYNAHSAPNLRQSTEESTILLDQSPFKAKEMKENTKQEKEIKQNPHPPKAKYATAQWLV
ncbi:BID domain-containing T4SS effector [Bartonella raoultii]|uniref:protein adenylyltransferase n=1 Tax=Bartonella raoultii TaxID=1457020 RepID=A0ABS7I3J3_9HYPH|nr:BID domain-containing T4SS effector [Bartonella raoultii]MBX4335238.1 BID domain-containing T4SS effector [Bartonella raoultii]